VYPRHNHMRRITTLGEVGLLVGIPVLLQRIIAPPAICTYHRTRLNRMAYKRD